jgi:hypothetical protein
MGFAPKKIRKNEKELWAELSWAFQRENEKGFKFLDAVFELDSKV